MFKQRFFTAILLIPLVFLGIYCANDLVLFGIIAGLMFGLAWEWCALLPFPAVRLKGVFIGVLLLWVWVIHQLLVPSLILNVGLWVAILLAIVTYPRTQSIWGRSWLMAAIAWFILSLFGNALWGLFHQNQGRSLLVYLLGLVWATDIGAYAFGKRWGKHRLIPNVSPGKTLEGCGGGILSASAIAGLGAYYFQPPNWLIWFVEAWLVISIAMLGDLWISMLKRRVKLKDTGHILPGHGGILDRLDSLVASLPLFYALILSHS